MKLKYNDWSKITIGLYKKLEAINKEDYDDITKEVKILSLLADEDEDTIWNLPINEINDMRSQCDFINKFEFPKNKKIKNVKIGTYDCEVCVDLNKYSYAQYVDFQTYFADDSNMSYLLSTIIVPKNKKYNEGYDLDEFIQLIENELSIVDGNVICFFLLTSFISSMKRINRYLLGTMMMKKMITKKTNPMYNKIVKVIDLSKQINHMLTSV